MADDLIEPHEATGDLELSAVRYAEGRKDPIGIASVRWKDEGSERVGESSRARLVLYLERGGKVFVRQDDARIPVEAVPAADGGGDVLRAVAEGPDLILALPRY